MKKIPLLLLAFAMVVSVAFSPSAQARRPVTAVAPGDGPLLIIDTSASNFGAVPNKGFAERTFLLKNAGDAPLHITQVRPTCGCTIAALADSNVAPGQATKLQIKLSADHRSPGNFYKNVYITSNSRSGEGAWLKFYGHFVEWQASQSATAVGGVNGTVTSASAPRTSTGH